MEWVNEFGITMSLDKSGKYVALANFNPAQPRVPPGKPEGGEWVENASSPTGYHHRDTGEFGTPAGTPAAQQSASSNISKSKTFQDFITGPRSEQDITAKYGKDTNDKFMDAMNKEMGFDAKPTIVSKSELDRHISSGGLELYRGVGGDKGGHKQHVDAFKRGEFFAGLGGFGNGTYTAIQGQEDWDKNAVREGHNMARNFAGGNDDGVMRMSIKSGANLIDAKEVTKKIKEQLENLAKEYETSAPDRQKQIKRTTEILSDPGRWAQLHRYDGIKHENIVVVLNRGALLVQDDKVDAP